jgi:toxin ParE1/3/4
MIKYKLSNVVKEDLIRLYHYGLERFGEEQAESYFNSFFDYFSLISQRPYSFELPACD